MAKAPKIFEGDIAVRSSAFEFPGRVAEDISSEEVYSMNTPSS